MKIDCISNTWFVSSKSLSFYTKLISVKEMSLQRFLLKSILVLKTISWRSLSWISSCPSSSITLASMMYCSVWALTLDSLSRMFFKEARPSALKSLPVHKDSLMLLRKPSSDLLSEMNCCKSSLFFSTAMNWGRTSYLRGIWESSQPKRLFARMFENSI